MIDATSDHFIICGYGRVGRRAAEEFGYEPSPEQLAFCVATYVAETDEKAHAEAKEHMMWLFHTGLKVPDHYFFPPAFFHAS